MELEKLLQEAYKESIEWRHYIHSRPELALEEIETSQFVQTKLKEFEIPYENNWAKTGVIGKLEVKKSNYSLGFRCELDALPIWEKNNFDYSSKNPGKMHACGHDGHIAGILGAAKVLSELYKKNLLKNTIYLIFQPAEENEGGAKKMIEEGFSHQYKMDAVFSIHNWPDLKEGIFGIKSGPIMASYDSFDIELYSEGSHAAMPHQSSDVVYITTQLIQNVYAFVSRMNPTKEKVISFTSIQTGSTYNVIPNKVQIKGTIRTFEEKIRLEILQFLEKILISFKSIYNIDYKFSLKDGYPATINSESIYEVVKTILKHHFGENKFVNIKEPSMGSEDFSYFLQYYDGLYIWLGANKNELNKQYNVCLHSPNFDFNDSLLLDIIKFWVVLALHFKK